MENPNKPCNVQVLILSVFAIISALLGIFTFMVASASGERIGWFISFILIGNTAMLIYHIRKLLTNVD